MSQDTYRMSYIYELYEEMSFERNLGLTDPLSVAWELIPYSFVVDWFVPIGTYLDNLNAIPKLIGRFLTIQTRRQRGIDTENAKLKLPLFIGGIPVVKQVGAFPRDTHRVTDETRTFSTSLSPPLPSFDLRGAIHGRRIWNAISLAQLRFGKGAGHHRRDPSPRKRIPAPPIFRGNSLV
jgi:hypothetical protein